MTKRVLFVFLVLAISIACAKTYTITLFQTSVVAGTELKAGEYQLHLNDTTVALKSGRQSVQATVKVENADSKFGTTAVRYASGEDKSRIQEIRLGGTKLKLVFN
jgi:cytochrome c biogenesis factor